MSHISGPRSDPRAFFSWGGNAAVLAEAFAFVAGGYLMLLGGMGVMQRDLIYHPSEEISDPVTAGVPEMAPVPVKAADGVRVTSWYAAPSRPDAPTVVLFHGNARTISARAHKARKLLDAGYGVFLAEYRGYGGNPGSPSEKGFYADARAALAWLRLRGVSDERMVLYGESLGSGVAVQMASEHAAAALVLEAPFTRLPDLAPPIVPPPLAQLMMLDHYDTLSKIGRLSMPLLVMHGGADWVVPIAMGREVLAAAQSASHRESLFIAAAGHNDLWNHGVGERVVDFLDRMAR
jgi:fermentation-respiration switch protein FrsA (DUF1100 family)